jgi:hypothetical protein
MEASQLDANGVFGRLQQSNFNAKGAGAATKDADGEGSRFPATIYQLRKIVIHEIS